MLEAADVYYFRPGTENLVNTLFRQGRCGMRPLQSRTLLVASSLLACFSVAAQTTSTEILGTVTDATGALVPGAKVTLVRVATGERY